MGTDALVEIQEERKKQEKVYNVLLEQDFKDKTIKDEIKALSDEDAAGTGGLTQKEGFHTASPFYEFVMGGMFSAASPEETKTKDKERKDDVYEVGIYKVEPIARVVPKPNSPQ